MNNVTIAFFRKYTPVFVIALFCLGSSSLSGASCSPPTISAVAGSDSICAGSSGSLTLSSNPQNDSSNCNGSYFVYAWYNGVNYWNGTGFTSPSPSYATSYYNIILTTPPAATTTYTVYVQCENNPSCSSSSSVAVTVVPQPVASTFASAKVTSTSTGSSGTLCQGGTLFVTANAGTGGENGSDNYQYSLNGGSSYSSISYANLSAGSGIALSGATVGNNEVIVQSQRLSSSILCGNSNWSSIATYTIVAEPTITSLTINNSSVCAGASVTLTATSSGGTGLATYTWQQSTSSSMSGPIAASGTNNGLTFDPTTTSAEGPIYYEVSVSYNGPGCSASAYYPTSSYPSMTVSPASVAPTFASANVSSKSISSSGTVCQGGTLFVTANSGSGGVSGSDDYQYSLNGGSTFFSISYANLSTGSGITLSDATIGSDEVVVQSQRLSSSVCGNSSWSTIATYTVVAEPTITGLTINNATVCIGGSATLTSTESGGTGTPTYTWQQSTSSSMTSPSSASGTNNGAQFDPTTSSVEGPIYYEVSVSYNGPGCTASPYYPTSSYPSMTVTSRITPAVSITVSPGDSICSGATLTFTATPVNGGNSPSYQWTNNSTVVGSNSDTYSANNFTNGEVIAAVLTSNAGCLSVNTATSNNITVTVFPSPAISFSGGNDTVCIDAAVTLSSTLTGGFGSPTYEWETSSSQSGTYTEASGSTTSTAYSPPTDSTGVNWYTVTLLYPTSTGCSVTAPIGQSVTVNNKPGVTISSMDTALCVHNSDQLTATVSGGAGTFTYEWQQSINGGAYASVSTTGLTYATPLSLSPASYSYEMVFSAGGSGCGAATSNAVPLHIVPLPAKPLFTAEADTVCLGTQGAAFTADSVISGDTYQWTASGEQIGAANQPDAAISFNNAGVYKVILTVVEDGGCSNSDTMAIVVNNTQAPDPSKPILHGNTLILLDTGYNYQWGYDAAPNWSPVTLSGETFQDLQLPTPIDTSSHHYWVIVSDGPCFSKIYFNGGLETGITSLTNQNKLKVYPNPADNFLIVQLSTEVKKALNISIYDLYGREIMKFDNMGNGQEARLDLNEAHLAPSIYLLTVYDGNEPVGNVRFIKE